jgi:hypothetical protein
MNIIQLVIVLFSVLFINTGSDDATQANQESSSLGYEFVDNYDIIDDFSKDWHDFQMSLVSNEKNGCFVR